MAGKCLGVAAALLGGLAAAAGDEPQAKPAAAAPAAAELAALVRKLDADLPAARDEAEAALAKFGVPLLDRLPKAEDPALSNEQRRRLAKVRAALWQARLAAELEGSWVDLPAGPKPLLDLLRDVERQTGNAIKDMREEFQVEPTNPTIAWDGKKRRFWEAFDDLCRLGNVAPAHLAGEGAIALQNNRAVKERAFRSGAFKFVLQGLTLEKNFAAEADDAPAPPGAARGGTQCVVRMQALFEPRFRVLQVEADSADFKLTDDRGQAVKPASAQKFTFGVEDGAHHFDMSLQIEPPARAAKKIAKLEGKIVVLIPANRETVEFPDWSAPLPAERKAAGMAIAVSGAKDEGDEVWSFTVAATGPAPEGKDGPADSYLAAAADQQVWLQKADGTRVTPNAGKNTAETEGGVSTEYLVSGAPGKMSDYKLVVRLPSGVARIPVAFALADIELP